MGIYRHKKTGRWIAQVWDPTKNDGKGGNRQVGSFEVKGRCKAPADDRRCCAQHALEADRQQEDAPSSAMTVAEWYAVWILTPTWRQSTRMRHQERAAGFIETHGHLRLQSVDRRLARTWIAGRPGDHSALSAMFGAALYEDTDDGGRLLASNPFSKLVRKKVAKRDIQADWLPAEALDLLQARARSSHGKVLGETIACMIGFAAETGVRPGELFVLEEDDLQPDHVEVGADGTERAAPRLLVRRAYESLSQRLGPPKNGEQRAVYLSKRALELARLSPRYEGGTTAVPEFDPYDRPVKGGEFWLPRGTPRLFSTRTGRQWTQPQLSVHWDPVRNAADRPGMDFYELRHYCATRLLELGLRDDEVAVQLGHTDGGKLVRDTYGHPNNRRALGRIADALDGVAA